MLGHGTPLQEDREELLAAAAKRKREATTEEGTSVSDVEMAQRLGAQGTAAATSGRPENQGATAASPGCISKRMKVEEKSGVKQEGQGFSVPPGMPQAEKVGSMRKKKKGGQSGGSRA